MADAQAAGKGRVWNWKPYIFLFLILALFYLPFPNRHPQFDGVGYYVIAQMNLQQTGGAVPTSHVLPQPFFTTLYSLHQLMGIQYSISRFFSLCDSLLMIGSLLILFGFYKNIIRDSRIAFLATLALGSCFAIWYFGTDIENVSLATFSAALLLNIGWRTSHKNTMVRGVLLGLLAVFATLCMQTLAVLSLFAVIYYFRQGKRRLAFSMLFSFIFILLLTYSILAFSYLGYSTLDEFKLYLLGHADISHTQSQGWMTLTPLTPFAAVVGFSRAILGLHPLMNLPWLKEMALTGLPGNVLSNQIAMAEGITPWLIYPLIATTIMLLLSLPVFLWFAWKGHKQTKEEKDSGIATGLLVLYAGFMALLTIIWLPQGGEFWLPVVIILIPLAARYLTRLKPMVRIYACVWVGLLAFTNLFGSIRPFADETVDPTLPSILYLDEIRQPDDLYLIPSSAAYPQHSVFYWVIPVASIESQYNSSDALWEKDFRESKGTIYFSSDLFNLKSHKELNLKGPTYYLATQDWENLTQQARTLRNIGSLEILAVKR